MALFRNVSCANDAIAFLASLLVNKARAAVFLVASCGATNQTQNVRSVINGALAEDALSPLRSVKKSR